MSEMSQARDDERFGVVRGASIETLEARLADGYARIEAAEAAGLDIAAWEGFWLDLLRQYEAACDSLPRAEAA